jgi:hypothetical protein
MGKYRSITLPPVPGAAAPPPPEPPLAPSQSWLPPPPPPPAEVMSLGDVPNTERTVCSFCAGASLRSSTATDSNGVIRPSGYA